MLKLCHMSFWFGVKKKKYIYIWESFLNRLADVRLPVVLCHLNLSSGAAEVVGRVYM